MHWRCFNTWKSQELTIKILLSIFISLCVSQKIFAFDDSNKTWTDILKNYRNEQGLFRYAKLKQDTDKNSEHPLFTYLKELALVKYVQYQNWDKNRKIAFLINAYNAFTIKLVISHYPLESITDIGGLFWRFNQKPWKMEFFYLLDGKIKKLDSIENEYLRSEAFKDYRIHAALNCASVSCPELRAEAYVGDKLDAQLDEQMQLWLHDPTRNQFDIKENEIHLSKVFDWYHEDFEKWGGGVPAILKKFAADKLESFKNLPDFDYLDYNWKLNEAL